MGNQGKFIPRQTRSVGRIKKTWRKLVRSAEEMKLIGDAIRIKQWGVGI
ncbi:unknown protein [Parachlamydia acanthamoebae UV-7]|uniref:Uncharacterized protein n=2 Tax=Parachlamydia acanthamoebae TaxID=83552 RepID=F8KWZ5_PARAV|nr:hypothetical protein DB43_GG00140 [Parachlamydia acanthamoebae]CCB86850.1 unknown protein [Parachlamydia acanthamoebae UV-7]